MQSIKIEHSLGLRLVLFSRIPRKTTQKEERWKSDTKTEKNIHKTHKEKGVLVQDEG